VRFAFLVDRFLIAGTVVRNRLPPQSAFGGHV
jgi:hypothetical protein